MTSFTCRGSGDIQMLSVVHWTLRFSMTISLASVGPAPIIRSRVSQRIRGDFRTASDLGHASKMSSPCTTPTNFPHGDLKEDFDIFPITIPAALIPFSICSRCHDLAACLVPYKGTFVSRNILSGCQGRRNQAARRTSSGKGSASKCTRLTSTTATM